MFEIVVEVEIVGYLKKCVVLGGYVYFVDIGGMDVFLDVGGCWVWWCVLF